MASLSIVYIVLAQHRTDGWWAVECREHVEHAWVKEFAGVAGVCQLSNRADKAWDLIQDTMIKCTKPRLLQGFTDICSHIQAGVH